VDFFHYLLGKKSEISDIETKDLLLAKTVLDIHRKRTHSSFILVPLLTIKPIHAIDRESAQKATLKRVELLKEVRELLLAEKNLSRKYLAEYLPSISWIKVVRDYEDTFIAYEGNGRVAALQHVFTEDDDIMVEVEEYHFKNRAKIIRRMNRVRRLNGLI